MASKPLLTTQIVIGDNQNMISRDPDGSMTFSDQHVPSLKLKDLVAGVIQISPALLIYVDENDVEWVEQSPNQYNQIFYKIVIQHNWNLLDTNDVHNLLQAAVLTKICDMDNIDITVESVKYFPDKIEILSSKKMSMKVTVKKLN